MLSGHFTIVQITSFHILWQSIHFSSATIPICKASGSIHIVRTSYALNGESEFGNFSYVCCAQLGEGGWKFGFLRTYYVDDPSAENSLTAQTEQQYSNFILLIFNLQDFWMARSDNHWIILSFWFDLVCLLWNNNISATCDLYFGKFNL